MAILLQETAELVETIIETTESGVKSFNIGGIFMQSARPNRNNRIYSKELMEREVNRYVKDYVKENRALGELSHPANRITICPERASHLITELHFEGNNVVGRAKVLSTPTGEIVKALLSDGVRVGMSSRALGSVKTRSDGVHVVQDDFQLKCCDCVLDPSAHDAFVTALHESKEWVMVNGIWSEEIMEHSQGIIRKATPKERDAFILEQFDKLFKTL